MIILPAISLGLISNFHCLGMCGPIALAIPVKSSSNASRIKSILIYNLGRIITYAIIGGIFGVFGMGLFIMGIQQQLSIVLGSIIIIAALLTLLNKKVHLFDKIFKGKGFNLQVRMKKYLREQGHLNNFILGLLNGLLPCGLVYFALIGALASGNILHGMYFMALFGVGTLPVMVALPWIKDKLTINLRSKLTKSIPFFLIIFGGLMVMRGSNLGIPYLSPKINKTEVSTLSSEVKPLEVDCCSKKSDCKK